MKSAITSLGCMLVAIYTFMIVTCISSIGVRSDELSMAVDSAMTATQKAVLDGRNNVTNDETYMADFTNNLLSQIESKSDIEIVFYTADFDNGILDVEVNQKYNLPFGKFINEGLTQDHKKRLKEGNVIESTSDEVKGKCSVRRTSIIDVNHPIKLNISAIEGGEKNNATGTTISLKNEKGEVVYSYTKEPEDKILEIKTLPYGTYECTMTYKGQTKVETIKYDKDSKVEEFIFSIS